MKKLFTILLGLLSTVLMAQNLQKGPYLIYPGVSSQMKVLWQLDNTYTCSIEWGNNPGAIGNSSNTIESNADEFGHQHIKVLTGLSPNTKYYYKVKIAGNELGGGSFKTPPASSTRKLKFVTLGDTRGVIITQTDNPTYDLIAKSVLRRLDDDPAYETFALYSGDFVAVSDEPNWQDHHFNRENAFVNRLHSRMPYQGVRGNHEDADTWPGSVNSMLEKYYPMPFEDHPTAPGENFYSYSFDYGPVHFTVVDYYRASYGNDIWSPGSPTLDWIRDDLAASTKEWNIVMGHTAGYSASDSKNWEYVRQHVQRIMEESGKHPVYINGDVHNYSHTLVNGTTHHLNISGGTEWLRDIDVPLDTLLTDRYGNNFIIDKFYNEFQSYGLIEVDDNEMIVRIYSSQNQMIDSLVIVHPVMIGDPLIDQIADTTLVDYSDTVTVMLSGIETAFGGDLSMTVRSSDASLIKYEQVDYTYPDTVAILKYLPIADVYGNPDITVIVKEQGADSTFMNFMVNMMPVGNNMPLLPALEPIVILENTLMTIDVSASDEDGDDLIVTAVIPSFGTWVDNGDGTGSLELQPEFGDKGDYTITVRVVDGLGGIAIRTFTVEVDEAVLAITDTRDTRVIAYPNPVSTILHLRLSHYWAPGKYVMNMYDERGNAIETFVKEVCDGEDIEIDLRPLGIAPGVYFLKLVTNNEDDQYKIIRFVKE